MTQRHRVKTLPTLPMMEEGKLMSFTTEAGVLNGSSTTKERRAASFINRIGVYNGEVDVPEVVFL